MRLLDAHLERFRQHADSFIEFPLGVTAIIGLNEAGKSAVLEAIVWAFFGGGETRGTMEHIRWWGAPKMKTASVTVRVEIGGKVYRIKRTETNARVYLDDTNEVIAEGTAPTNAFIPELLGKSFTQFVGSDLVQQEDLNHLASMGGVERQAFIRELMGVGSIDVGLKACRKKKSELSTEMEGLRAGLGEREPLQQALADAQHAVEHKNFAAALASQGHEKATGAHKTAANLLEISDAVEAEFSAASRNIEREMGKIHTLDGSIEDLEVDLEVAKRAHERVLEAGPFLAKLPGLREERDGLKEAAATASALDALVSRRDQLYTEIETLRGQIKDAQAQAQADDPEALAAANTVAGAADKKLEAFREKRLGLVAQAKANQQAARTDLARQQLQAEKVLSLGHDGDCPFCTQKLGDHFQVLLASLQEGVHRSEEIIDDITNDLPELEYPSDEEIESEIIRDDLLKEVERLVQLQKDAANGTTQAAAFGVRLTQAETDLAMGQQAMDALPSVTVNPERLEVVEREIFGLKERDTGLSEARGLATQIPTIADRLTLAAAQRTEALADLEVATNHLATLTFNPQAHKALQEEAEKARGARENARVEAARADEAHKAAVKTVESATAALSDYDRRGEYLESVTAQHLLHERCATRLADFRVAVAATIRPEMEELMSGYVHLLTDGKHEAVELSEDFTPILYESGIPCEVISGGCKNIAALAQRLSISQMHAERASDPTGILLLDEIFGSLDPNRRANVQSLIQHLQSIFPQIVLISHVPETKDAVDHVVELVFDEGEGRTRVVA